MENTGKKSETTRHLRWLLLLLVLILMLFLSRGLIWLIPTVIGPALLGLFAYWMYQAWSQSETPDSEPTIIAGLQNKIRTCLQHKDEQERELAEINDTISDLQRELKQEERLSPSAWAETQNLLDAFQSEKALRNQKIAFFTQLKERFEKLLDNERINLKLKDKREQLTKMREEHYEDLAKMEALKQSYVFNEDYLHSLNDLHDQLTRTTSVDQLQQLKAEFEKILREF